MIISIQIKYIFILYCRYIYFFIKKGLIITFKNIILILIHI